MSATNEQIAKYTGNEGEALYFGGMLTGETRRFFFDLIARIEQDARVVLAAEAYVNRPAGCGTRRPPHGSRRRQVMSDVKIKTRICDQHVYVIAKVGDKPAGSVLVSMNGPFLAARLRGAAARLRKRHAAIEAITDALPTEAEGDSDA